VRQQYILDLTHADLGIKMDLHILSVQSASISEIQTFEASSGVYGGPRIGYMRPDLSTERLKTLWNQKWTELMVHRAVSHFSQRGANAVDRRSEQYWTDIVWSRLGTMSRLWRQQQPRLDPRTGEQETDEAILARIRESTEDRLRSTRHAKARRTVRFNLL
jgi:hypothetical protein